MKDFGPNDQEIAAAFYRDIADPTAKAVLDYLIDHPDQRSNGAALATHLGLPRHHDVARATYLLGEAARARGRTRPWNEAQQGYSMPAEQAELLRQVRA